MHQLCKKTGWGFGVFFCLLFSPPGTLAVEPAPRLTDREIIERLTRLEEGQKTLARQLEASEQHVNQRIDSLEQHVNQRIDSLEQHVNQRIDSLGQEIAKLRQLLLWGFGVMFTGMFALTGFVIWDRRTALAPAVNRVEALEKRERLLEEVLRNYALKVPDLAEELRKARLF